MMEWSRPLTNTVRLSRISGGVTGSRLSFFNSLIPFCEVMESMVSVKSEYAANPLFVSVNLHKYPLRFTQIVLKIESLEGRYFV